MKFKKIEKSKLLVGEANFLETCSVERDEFGASKIKIKNSIFRVFHDLNLKFKKIKNQNCF